MAMPDDPNVSEDIFGNKQKSVRSLRWQEWLFIAISILSLGGVIGLTIERVVEYANQPVNNPDFTFAIVLLINAVFCGYYVFSGIRYERLFEMYMFMAGTLVVMFYCAIEYAVNSGRRSDVKLARLVVSCALGPVNLFLAVLVVRTFGWLEFRVVGPSEIMQKMYRQRSFVFSLISFDLQASLSFIVLALTNGESITTPKIIVSAVGMPFTIVWGVLVWIAVKREKVSLCICVAVFSLLVPGYVIYQIVILVQPQQFTVLVTMTIVAGALLIAIRIVLMYELRVSITNFNHGLKEQVFNFETVNYDIHRVTDLCCACR